MESQCTMSGDFVPYGYNVRLDSNIETYRLKSCLTKVIVSTGVSEFVIVSFCMWRTSLFYGLSLLLRCWYWRQNMYDKSDLMGV